MSIPDLLQLSEIQHYIFQRTGIRVSKNQISKWIKSGKIPTFRLQGSKKYTTKRTVDKFIKEHSGEKIFGDERKGYSTLLECHRRIRDNKKPNSNSVV